MDLKERSEIKQKIAREKGTRTARKHIAAAESLNVKELLMNTEYEFMADNIAAFIEKIPIGELMYPWILKKDFNYLLDDICGAFSILERNNIVKAKFIILCPNCTHSEPIATYDYLGELPDEIICPFCGKTTSVAQYLSRTLIAYEKL